MKSVVLLLIIANIIFCNCKPCEKLQPPLKQECETALQHMKEDIRENELVITNYPKAPLEKITASEDLGSPSPSKDVGTFKNEAKSEEKKIEAAKNEVSKNEPKKLFIQKSMKMNLNIVYDPRQLLPNTLRDGVVKYNTIIPAYMDEKSVNPEAQGFVIAAAKHYLEKTCIRWDAVKSPLDATVKFSKGETTKTSNPIGEKVVKIKFDDKVNFRTVVHEMGHALGLGHEHNYPGIRSGNDQKLVHRVDLCVNYYRVTKCLVRNQDKANSHLDIYSPLCNDIPSASPNFNVCRQAKCLEDYLSQYKEETNTIGKYDPSSIMHYQHDLCLFSFDNINILDEYDSVLKASTGSWVPFVNFVNRVKNKIMDKEVGTISQLSTKDIKALNKLYKCTKLDSLLLSCGPKVWELSENIVIHPNWKISDLIIKITSSSEIESTRKVIGCQNQYPEIKLFKADKKTVIKEYDVTDSVSTLLADLKNNEDSFVTSFG